MSERFDNDSETIQDAHSVQLATCGDPACNHVHLLFLDDDQAPFAQALLTAEVVQRLLERVRDIIGSERLG